MDLAGAERVKKTGNSGIKLVEACNINKNLLVLSRCIKALSNKKKINPPFRESLITRIL